MVVTIDQRLLHTPKWSH